jgi:hypothetical protein
MASAPKVIDTLRSRPMVHLAMIADTPNGRHQHTRRISRNQQLLIAA